MQLSTITLQLRINYDPDRLNPGVVFSDELRVDLASVTGVQSVELVQKWQPPTSDQLNTFNAYELRELGWPPSLDRPVSVRPHDAPTDRVKVISYELGRKLALIDPDSTVFHVELHPSPRDRDPFAEVWTAAAWRDVRQARERFALRRQKSEAELDLKSRVDDLLAVLRYHIATATKCPAETAALGAKRIIEGGEEWQPFMPFLKLSQQTMAELEAVKHALKHDTDQTDP